VNSSSWNWKNNFRLFFFIKLLVKLDSTCHC
jgi:hypothetical protein